jgi:adenine-specific DNA-methyltransferase
VNEYSEITQRYLDTADIDYRKSKGQYFTPRSVRERLLRALPRSVPNPRIIDPSCGTGEFLASAAEYFENPLLFGWEIDGGLAALAKEGIPSALINHTDALQEEVRPEYDYVVGNPPFYEFVPNAGQREKYKSVISGRTNIFSFFIRLGLDLLKEGGYLAYVLPPSMNNGAFFAGLRKTIIEETNIEYMEVLHKPDLFDQALQAIMLLVLRKGPNKGNYIFKRNGVTIFAERPQYLREAFVGKTSLSELGFSVKTGRLIWNQNKNLLTDSAEEGIPLIWSHNISESGLKFPVLGRKPQYVKRTDPDVGPVVIVNRITGPPKKARIRAAYVPEGMKFLAENHCNVIFPPEEKTFPSRLSFESLIAQLKSEKNLTVMQNITGNTQISRRELAHLFPISA